MSHRGRHQEINGSYALSSLGIRIPVKWQAVSRCATDMRHGSSKSVGHVILNDSAKTFNKEQQKSITSRAHNRNYIIVTSATANLIKINI